MVNRVYPINIGPKHYSKEFQLDADYAKSWRSVLEKAYGTTNAQCCCPGRGDRKLAIKRREGTDSYHLARFPAPVLNTPTNAAFMPQRLKRLACKRMTWGWSKKGTMGFCGCVWLAG